ncbi:MAG: DUF4416 family protein [bacterium]
MFLLSAMFLKSPLTSVDTEVTYTITMGKIKDPIPVKLICGIISGSPELFDQAKQQLSQRYGAIDYISPIMSFSQYTDYYEPEMGKDLQRQFISFEKLVDPIDIVSTKRTTNQIELDLISASAGMTPNTEHGRMINLDPGYVSNAKLVLATTKDYQHRLYLGQGIYAEVTLRFRQGKFEPFEWTYPDYKTPEYLAIFNQIRAIYSEQLKWIKKEM